jgi:hypothetical protein
VSVTSDFSFRKLASPIPLTFINSSNLLGRIVSLMFIGVNSRCAHQVRPPAPAAVGRSTVGKPFATTQDLPKYPLNGVGTPL